MMTMRVLEYTPGSKMTRSMHVALLGHGHVVMRQGTLRNVNLQSIRPTSILLVGERQLRSRHQGRGEQKRRFRGLYTHDVRTVRRDMMSMKIGMGLVYTIQVCF